MTQNIAEENARLQATIAQQEVDLEKSRIEIQLAKQKADEKEKEDNVAAQVNTAVGSALSQTNLLDKLNSLATLVTCDADCQRTKQLETLRERFYYWSRTLREAPDKVAKSEQEYVTFDKGAEAYNTLIFGRNTQTAADIQTKADEAHAIVKTDLDILVQQYVTDSQVAYRLQELLVMKVAEYVTLKQQENRLDQDRSTLGRKVLYEDSDRNSLKFFNRALLFLYYGVLFMYIVFGSFFSKAQYMNRAVWLILANYILFPFVAYWFTVQLFNVKHVVQHLFREVPHQNVYRNI
jgi:hypothetical protein